MKSWKDLSYTKESHRMVEYDFIKDRKPVLRSPYSKGAEWTMNCGGLIIKYPTYLLPHSIIQDFCVKDCIKEHYRNDLSIVPQNLNGKTIAHKLFIPFWIFKSSTPTCPLVLHEFEIIWHNWSVVCKGFCKPNHWISEKKNSKSLWHL